MNVAPQIYEKSIDECDHSNTLYSSNLLKSFNFTIDTYYYTELEF